MTYRVDHSIFDWDKLENAIHYAKAAGARIAKITGKWGEPLMVPERITGLLTHLYDFDVEVQTNALLTWSKRSQWGAWNYLGLDLVSISCVHWDQHISNYIYGSAPELELTINFLKTFGYRIRLNCLLLKGMIDCPAYVDEFILKFPRVDQISFIPVNAPSTPLGGKSTNNWIQRHKLSSKEIHRIINYLDNSYEKTNETCYSRTYEHREMSIYFADCLKLPEDTYRHLIYFPDGTLRYSWENPDSIVKINL